MLVLTGWCVWVMFQQYPLQSCNVLSTPQKIKLMASGFLAFVADCIGVGSFAVNIALAKFLNTFSDEELPPMVNGAQIVPGALEAIFFMQLINVDMTTLIVLVLGTCIGGILGGHVVSKLSKQAIRFSMMICFSFIICLIISKQLNLMPVGGNLTALTSWKLLIGFFAMLVCGALTSVGIGLFAMVQGVLFLLNVSPAVAFPIMTTAGAMQQPLTTLVFLKQKKIPLKRTFFVSLGGCLGVLAILPIFKWFTTTWLHNLLITILFYNLISIGKAFIQQRKAAHLECLDQLYD
ncbi:MAG: sulfite exporter TauE/SafE family protein [Gammaproteobacteria bacterium]|nr:sulfite exporter TauE/SafE family protein [Gammaproteobacteria bacterium]